MERNVLILFVIAVQLSIALGATYKTVLTPSGPVRGIGVQNRNGMVYQYRKIPFAKPPVGDLRLRKPVPFGRWTNALDATSFGPSCFQSRKYILPDLPNQDMSEDCLHLNVYTPSSASPGDKKNVMVWIHGGGYYIGQATFYDASNLANVGDVIVVTVNYRLGFLGFLSTGDDAALGNFGLWDQKMAMQWVKDNIAAFGGNNEYITLFGESAGGFSVALQALNPHNRGLFQRVIVGSGTANSPLALHPEPTKVARGFGINLKCVNELDDYVDSRKAIECVRSKTAEEILNAQDSLDFSKYTNYSIPLSITPVIDGEMIFGIPEVTLANISSEGTKFFRSLDAMIGTTDSEGSLLFALNLPDIGKNYGFNASIAIPRNIVCDVLAAEVAKEFYGSNSNVARAICAKYSSTNSIQQSRNAVNMYTDAVMVAPSVRSLDSHSIPGLTMGRNTFQYIFSREKRSFLSRFPSWFKGARHGSEIPYIFGPEGIAKLLNRGNSQADAILSDYMMKYWANFAKHGSPNGPGVPYWPRYDPVSGLYLTLDTTISSGFHVTEDRIKLWNKQLPALMGARPYIAVGK